MTSKSPRATRTARRLCAAALFASAITAQAVPAANAQLPTLPGTKQTVVVDASQASILVNTPDLEAGRVTGTIVNKTASQLTCRGLPNPDTTDEEVTRTPALSATRETTIAQAERYYAQFPFVNDPVITVEPPVIGQQTIGLGSVYTLLPSALAGLIWPDAGMRAEIASAVTDARLAGQFGTIQDVTVPANGTLDFTVPLGPPTSGERQDFQAGVFLACQVGNTYRVMAGYESGQRPDENSGSVGTLFDTGVFGS